MTDFISLMLAPREERKDFNQLDQIIDSFFENNDSEEGENKELLTSSVFPYDQNVNMQKPINLTCIHEEKEPDDLDQNLRSDLTSSPDFNCVQEDDKFGQFSLNDRGSMIQSCKIDGMLSLPSGVKDFTQSQAFIDKQKIITSSLNQFENILSIESERINEDMNALILKKQKEQGYQSENDYGGNNGFNYNQIKGKTNGMQNENVINNQIYQSDSKAYYNRLNGIQQMEYSKVYEYNAESLFKGILETNDLQNVKMRVEFDEKLQIPIDSSHLFYVLKPQETLPIQNQMRGDVSEVKKESWMKRSNEMYYSSERQITYEQLINKAKTLKNIRWVDRKKIIVGAFVGEGQQSVVHQCTIPERNCCIVKQYAPKTHLAVWEMIQSLNQFEKVPATLTIRVESFYIEEQFSQNELNENQIKNKGDNSQIKQTLSRLWLIQKKKTYNLKSLLTSQSLSLSEKLKIANSITLTITQLHNTQPPIIHGDLKPQNILIDLKKNAFLTDFGMSETSLTSSQLIRSRSFDLGYSAPEQINDMCVCMNSDIWSLAIIFQELIMQSKVTPTMVEGFGLYDASKQGCIDFGLHPTSSFYNVYSDLIKRMTQYDPDKRISLQEVIKQLQILEDLNNAHLNNIGRTPMKRQISMCNVQSHITQIVFQQQKLPSTPQNQPIRCSMQKKYKK